MLARTASLLLAVATNLFLVGVFYSALIDPVEYKDFIYRTGIMIFVIEFMTLHSSGMFFGSAQKAKQTGKRQFGLREKIGLFVFYNLFVVVFAAQTGQWLAAVYFAVSLGSKAVYSRSIDVEERLAPVAAGIVMLLLSTFIVVFAAKPIAGWFPIPAEARSARMPGTGGLFVSKPQTLMMWGVLYFLFMTVCDVAIFRKSLRHNRNPSAAGNLGAATPR